MTPEETKKKAEEMVCDAVAVLHENIKDEKVLNEKYLELATSFVTLTLNPEKDFKELATDIKQCCKDIYNMAIAGMFRFKSDDTSRVVRVFEDDK